MPCTSQCVLGRPTGFRHDFDRCRGGLFFASLLLGALGGRIFAGVLSALSPGLVLDPHVYSIIGMGALSVSVIGGPLTMTFIALETTGDFWLFGYSFATWRFHLRGETIRSAADAPHIYTKVACTAKRNFDHECKRTFATKSAHRVDSLRCEGSGQWHPTYSLCLPRTRPTYLHESRVYSQKKF